ncbi:pyridoxal-phosphate dependent enzyme [Cupriavidus consociatus]|uniref:pyridoxal-phosphate dependent enzyme n=1 Tax=Cupriavidus consociatus TaxID=2821357 RepID=UPI001AE628A1|nr:MULTISPECIES: pyridoxal-phosphate dependent enzyme [unclassified Cupriavidus]MBP0622358.1 pyridoxal-phosphate dependent enzyme [Cupriavidus sp. LEh25]MDK2659040.1 pyridoxal-phosphate dependent enzyme [Cupriavidus sp. LEh21]
MTLYIHTPLLRSQSNSIRLGKTVWLKMEGLQPSGSFKLRGISHACTWHMERGAKHFVSSSGGNAGMAVAYCGRILGLPVTVVVPESTSARARALIGLEGASLVVHGKSWAEANAYAMSLLTEHTAFIHPFDDALLWEGHATLIDEVAQAGVRPGAVLLSVGGGGLLCGVLEGMTRNGWGDVPVVAVETEGAASYSASIAVGRPVSLPEITSIATSLGARSPCQQAVDWAQRHPIRSVVVSDAAAVAACLRLLDEHRVLVEPACGATLAALDHDISELNAAEDVLVVVCGGASATVADLLAWQRP